MVLENQIGWNVLKFPDSVFLSARNIFFIFCAKLEIFLFFLFKFQGGGYKVQKVRVYKVFFSVREMGGYKVQQFSNFPESGWL